MQNKTTNSKKEPKLFTINLKENSIEIVTPEEEERVIFTNSKTHSRKNSKSPPRIKKASNLRHLKKKILGSQKTEKKLQNTSSTSSLRKRLITQKLNPKRSSNSPLKNTSKRVYSKTPNYYSASLNKMFQKKYKTPNNIENRKISIENGERNLVLMIDKDSFFVNSTLNSRSSPQREANLSVNSDYNLTNYRVKREKFSLNSGSEDNLRNGYTEGIFEKNYKKFGEINNFKRNGSQDLGRGKQEYPKKSKSRFLI